MSSFSAIRAVTSTLKSLLMAQLPGVTIEEKKAPVDVKSSASMIGLYLYRIDLNPSGANLDWQASGDTNLFAPPIALNLHYLITPYGPDELDIQQTLGEVIRAFHEQPIVRAGDPVLSADLADMTEELRIVPRMLPFHDLLELWRAFESVPFRLCATYEVSTIVIDSRITRNVQRVQERVLDLIPRP